MTGLNKDSFRLSRLRHERRSGVSASSRIVRRELRNQGYHDHMQPLATQSTLPRIQGDGFNGSNLTVIELWKCGKMVFGVMNLALQFGSPMDASWNKTSIHTSRLRQPYFDEMGVRKLDWFSHSPDLNAIEHFCNEQIMQPSK
ncbi:hypothetical protein TNCV_325601 [Trichonephila clavipes]|nr:hypothetical protein TNCV_325601 [Trichonephila clavipes]